MFYHIHMQMQIILQLLMKYYIVKPLPTSFSNKHIKNYALTIVKIQLGFLQPLHFDTLIGNNKTTLPIGKGSQTCYRQSYESNQQNHTFVFARNDKTSWIMNVSECVHNVQEYKWIPIDLMRWCASTGVWDTWYNSVTA